MYITSKSANLQTASVNLYDDLFMSLPQAG